MTSIEAFAIPSGVELSAREFSALFLNSSDFTHAILKRLGGELRLHTGGRKAQISEQLAAFVAHRSQGTARQRVIEHLLGRPRKGMAIKVGQVQTFPSCSDATELVISPGEEKWYGPITDYRYDEGSRWYIRPVFVEHWQMIGDGQLVPVKYLIRWLCFARLRPDMVSLHWRGFSLTNHLDRVARAKSQFRYWEPLPELFGEIERLTKSKLNDLDLRRLILHDLWDRYRGAENYKWEDTRIRAESNGVSLSAHRGANQVRDIDVSGILSLAQVIRRSIERELREGYKLALPEPRRFDEVVLRTLIRQYGPLSYEFRLERDTETLFKAHSYFGRERRERRRTVDSVPHLILHTGSRSVLGQLEFLIEHAMESSESYETNEPEPLRLFP